MVKTPIAQPDYETKPIDYFEGARPEMLPFIPAHCRRLLDVGCGAGGFGASIKRSREIEIWGVEPVESAAAKASAKLDRVINGPFDSEIGLPAGTFDCIVFNDVLEHMAVPEQALRHAKVLLSPGGVIVASIPNIRSFPVLWQLVAHARWEYVDAGVLDKTHLRFFTKSSIENMFTTEGYSLESICGINAYAGTGGPGPSRSLWGAYKLVNALLLGKFADMKYIQFAVVAKTAPHL
ncbi:MAG: class I SAM-dependent methyltransferase [Candidatus Acidiferrales bacterium]